MKRSAILLLMLALVSFSLVLFTSYQSTAASSMEAEQESPVKCSGGCNKKNPAPLPWNIISPAMFPNQG